MSGRGVSILLYLALLTSPFVMIEPAPYEGMVVILAIGWMLSGPRLERGLVPLLGFFLVWTVGATLSVMQVMASTKSVQSFLVSLYLQATAIIFAAIFAQDTERRIETLRRGYVAAGAIAAALGVAGYFGLFPGADALMEYGRAKSTFKDPNVFGPFLVLPILMIMQSALLRGLRLRDIALGGLMLIGLLLSFSRGAWANLIEAAIFMIVMMLVTAPSGAQRRRIVVMSMSAAAGLVVMLAALLAFESVSSMFEERASLSQSYDQGATGRFGRQAAAVTVVLTNPNGLGPAQFSTYFPEEPHQVYLTAMISHGWIGGLAYLSVVLLTLVALFRAMLIRTAWQPMLIACYAAYVALVLEGFVIDSDHWRHYYLLLGLVWGLALASFREAGRLSMRSFA